MELAGWINGKAIFVGSDGKKSKRWELENHLRVENRVEYLRKIAHHSAKASKIDSKGAIYEIDGMGIAPDFIRHLSELTVKFTQPNSKYPFSEKRFIEFVSMAYYQYGAEIVNSSGDPEKIWRIQSYRQFGYNEQLHNLIARSYYLYSILWKTVPKAADLDIESAISNEIGTSYRKSLLLTLLHMTFESGHFERLDEASFQEVNSGFGKDLFYQDYQNYLNWVSIDHNSPALTSEGISPFLNFPIIKTDFMPQNYKSPACVIVSRQDLILKATRGIYFHLSDRLRSGKSNPFKVRFGYVFEEYVGNLLKYHLQTHSVKPEKYKKQKNSVDSIDWICKKGKSALLVEVKQASIYLKSKLSGDFDDYKKDLNQTLIDALTQIKTFYDDVQSGQYPELKEYIQCEVQGVIVMYDPLYNAMDVLQKVIDSVLGMPKINIHVINIEDLELLLDNMPIECDLFEVLKAKSASETKKDQDFKEFVISEFPQNGGSKFLAPYYTELVGR